MPVIQLFISSSVEAYLLWKCCLLLPLQTEHCAMNCMFYMWCQMWQELQENCVIKAPNGKSSKTAVLVILSMRSLVLHQTAEPQEALWHVSPSACWDTPPGRHPLGRHPQADTPGRHTPQADTPQADNPGRHPSDRHLPSGRHLPPTDGYCWGRYVSYWNAFLLFLKKYTNCCWSLEFS